MKRELMIAVIMGLTAQVQAQVQTNTPQTAPTNTVPAQNAPAPAAAAPQQPAPAKVVTQPVAAATAVVPAVNTAAAAPQKLTSDADRLSYAIGLNVGQSFKSQGININTAIFYQGIQAGFAGGQGSLMTVDEVRQTLMEFQQAQVQKQQQQLASMSKTNQTASDAFLAANKLKPGVITLANGLQYKIIEAGKGRKPSATDEVKVDYEGKLFDGKVFDSSYKRGAPTTFPVNAVIPGWTQILQMMPVGSTWEVYIPSQLAYGDRGAGTMIQPGAALVFKIHLIGIEKQGAQTSAVNKK